MKLKGLKTRAYNVFFHTHTVAGIVISFALFVIFYAGAFSLFRHDVARWENPNMRIETPESIDYDRAMAALESYYGDAFAPAELTTIRPPTEDSPFIKFYGAKYTDDSREETERFFSYIDANDNYKVTDAEEAKTTMSNTIYHLHYFRQIPVIGIYLSGLVAVFFLFATVTGIMIHWRNLVTKFYAFTVKGKWKQIWTNAHTVLGVIGIPFQVAYGITGAFYGLLTLLLIPSAFILFGGDTDAIVAVVRPDAALKVEADAPKVDHASLQSYHDQVTALYPEVPVSNVRMANHGREDGYVIFNLDDERTINGTGQVVYALNSGEELFHTPPSQNTYTQSVINVISKLHFATFGGLGLRIVYFILAMITCFMILSGVLLWQEARNNKRYTEKQKRFHHRVTKVYLAICLGLFPATALIFIANKVVPMELVGRTTIVNSVFFLGWLALIIAGLFWNNFRRLNLNYLSIGGLFSLLIPVANGVVTGDWFWSTLTNAQWYVASVDLFWLMTGVSAFLAVWMIQRSRTKSNIRVEKSQKLEKKDTALV
ncbi:MAG: PepSY-associated TM helix domain-containing protein [Bacteroidota bacterium]